MSTSERYRVVLSAAQVAYLRANGPHVTEGGNVRVTVDHTGWALVEVHVDEHTVDLDGLAREVPSLDVPG